jgi:hypothetical protein
MTTFTRIVRDYLLTDPDMPAAVRDFIRAEQDPTNRVLKFAVVLSENFATAFGRPDARDDADAVLVKRLIEFASQHVSWAKLAKDLLGHFATPARIALPAGCSNRLTEALSAWHGTCN